VVDILPGPVDMHIFDVLNIDHCLIYVQLLFLALFTWGFQYGMGPLNGTLVIQINDTRKTFKV